MMYSRSSGALVLPLFLFLLSACATEEARTSKKPSPASTSDSTPAVPVKTPKQTTATPAATSMAPTYDTVEACLARIPSDSTAGTRMLAEGSCRREGPVGSSLLTTDTKTRNRLASGSVEDSLDACIARIPQDASAGQRMLAAESCKRDQGNQR